MQELVSFEVAIKALRQGLMVARKSWEKGTFIYRLVPFSTGVSKSYKMFSLPVAVEHEFADRLDRALEEGIKGEFSNNNIHFFHQILIVHPNNYIHGWSASAADILEEDWFILK